MTETIAGLHKCQPKNAPEAGTIKNMVVLNMPAKNGKKAWIKIKSEKPEKGGSPYRLINVEPLDWPPDDYGNIAFNIEVEATTAQPTAFANARATMQQGETDDLGRSGDPQDYGDGAPPPPWRPRTQQSANASQSPTRAQQGEDGPMSKDDYWRRKENRDEERQRFIIRQSAQKAALEVLSLKHDLGQLSLDDLTPSKLKQLTDWFYHDTLEH